MINTSDSRRTSTEINRIISNEKLHERLSLARFFNIRILICSSIILPCSLLGWLLATPLLIHSLILALCLIVPWSFPRGKRASWGLTKLTEQTGLSYETAMEYSNQTDDKYDLIKGLRMRREEMVRNFEVPRYPPWWIPLLILSIGFLFLPSPGGATEHLIRFPTNALDNIDSNKDLHTADDPGSYLRNNPDPELELRQDLPKEHVPSEHDTLRSNLRSDIGVKGKPTDENILADFVTNLSNRNAATDLTQSQPNPTTGPTSPQAPSPVPETTNLLENAGMADQGSSDEPGAGPPSASQDLATDPEGVPDGLSGIDPPENAAPFLQETQSVVSGQNNETDSTNKESVDTQEGLPLPSQTSPNDNEPNASPEDAVETLPGEGNLDGDQPGNGSTPGKQLGEATGTLLPNQQREKVESEFTPEFIEGVPSRSRNNRGGLTEVHGEKNSVTLSDWSEFDYVQTPEKAITEGRIPVDYQEIIRNYFR